MVIPVGLCVLLSQVEYFGKVRMNMIRWMMRFWIWKVVCRSVWERFMGT